MIVDSELAGQPLSTDIPTHSREHVVSSALRSAAILLLFFVVALVLQTLSGAYHAEFNGYPDESAHYVTSLMVRQFMMTPHPGSPVRFAQDYYAHYPKVAFGHWPPFLYFVQALWMSVFTPARASVLIELALTTAVLAYTVYLQARRWLAGVDCSFETLAGVSLGLLTIAIPLVQRNTAEEMSETLLALTCFWSAIHFVDYLDSGRWQSSLLFGLFFALAVLTKGSGWLLTLVPPIALLLTRKLSFLLRPSFWIAPLLVAVTCIPWQLMTMHLVEEGWEGGPHPSAAYTFAAISGFAVVFFEVMGPVLLLLAAVGIFVLVLVPLLRRPVPSLPAVMFALILADWLFHSIVPAGVEDRKLIMAVPPLLLFALRGVFWLADRLPAPPALRKWRVAMVALLAALFFSVQTFAIPHEKHYGYIEAARYIAATPPLRTANILVSSDSGGEGPFIAEVAMCEPRPNGIILRATKALAYVSFDADIYRQFFPDSQGVLKYLYQNHVSLVVLDTFPPSARFPHQKLLWQLVREPATPFHLIATFPSSAAAGQVQLYSLKLTH